MASGYRSAIESMVLTSEPMSDENQIPNSFTHLSEAADAAEDAVKACERLHLDRLTIHYTLQEYESVIPECQRLRDATEKLEAIIMRKWELLKTTAEESEKSFQTYTDDAVRRVKHVRVDVQGTLYSLAASEEKRFRSSIRKDVIDNLVAIFEDDDHGATTRTGLLRRELTHGQMVIWCFAFPFPKWSGTAVSQSLFLDLVRCIKRDEAPQFREKNVNGFLKAAQDKGLLKRFPGFKKWLQEDQLLESSLQ